MDLLFVYSGDFGEKAVGNLINHDKFCTACDPTCSSCRFGRFNWSPDIKQVMIAPGQDDLEPGEDSGFGLEEPDAEIAFLIDVHPDIMLEFADSLQNTAVRAVIVPIERPGIGTGLARQLESLLNDAGIDFASPKPFCSLTPESPPPVIRRFISASRLGGRQSRLRSRPPRSGSASSPEHML